jgi:hypothetical protein
MTWRALEQNILKRIRVWWRPATCVGIAGGVIINAVVLPLMKSEPMDLTGFAAVIASCATIFAVREWGKIKGVE